MFSVRQKRHISGEVQKILRATKHPELPDGEITFWLHVDGKEGWSWADIKNNGRVEVPFMNPHNEAQDIDNKELTRDSEDPDDEPQENQDDT